MASRLSLLASAASAYMKRRASSNPPADDDTTDARSPAGLLGNLAGLFSRRQPYKRRGPPRDPMPPGDWMLSSPGAPPANPPPPPITGNAPTGDDWDDDEDRFDNITILGRDKSYDADDWAEVSQKMRLVSSSNVYGYLFQLESRTSGILYVQYLDYTPSSQAMGGTGERGGPGPVYAYYDIPLAKYKSFEAMAESSAGGAVWDYCRVRGSKFEHQHNYRLIQTSGDYVPRKTTAAGFKPRNTAAIGIGKRNKRLRDGGHARKQLQAQTFHWKRILPNGAPNRGTPDRGRP